MKCNINNNGNILALAKKNNLKILNQTDVKAQSIGEGVVKIDMIGVIGDDWDYNTTTYELKNWSGIEDDTKEIHLHIDSQGGDLFAGISMYHFLKNHPAKVITYNAGNVSSAATLPFIAGDERIMPVGTTSIIHDPWSCGCFNQYEASAFSEQMKVFSDQLIDIYDLVLNIDKETIRSLLKGGEYEDGTILTSSTAIQYDFATSAEVTNSFNDNNGNDNITTKNAIEFIKVFNAVIGDKQMTDKSKNKDELTLPEVKARVAILETSNKAIMDENKELKAANADLKSLFEKADEEKEGLRAEQRKLEREDIKELFKVQEIANKLGIAMPKENDDMTSVDAKRHVLNHINVPDSFDTEIFPDTAVNNTFEWYIKESDTTSNFDNVVDDVVNDTVNDDDDVENDSNSPFNGMIKV